MRKPDPTDLTDTQWKEIAPHYSGMRNRKWSKRELTNAVDISEKIKPYEWEKLPWRWIVKRTFGWLNAASSLIKVFHI